MKKLHFMPHQDRVLKQTEPFNRVAYYLDMGLGKTFVGAEKVYLLNNAVNLVICQKSKIDDWVQHFKEYYPNYRVLNLTKKTEAITFRNLIDTKAIYNPSVQIVGAVNYETAFRRDWLLKLQDFTLMLDESSLITNENAKRSKFILKMKPESVVLLSGTPTAGKYEKLWSQVQLLGWDISKKAFWNSYVETTWIDEGCFKREVVVGYKHVEHLKKKLAEHGAVFMKTEEVIDLPEQIEQKIMVKPTKEYKYFIQNSYLVTKKLDAMVSGWKTGVDVELVGDNSLTKMLYARQLCGQYSIEKLEAFEDLIFSTNDRLIVFYNFNEELEILHQIALKKTPNISVLNGQRKDLQAYNLYDDSITFIQYQAGAMGGNFQKANKIVYYTLPLGKGSCDLWEQSKKRIHRIGQKKSCFYYYLLVKGSIEEKNLAALREGKELTDELFKES
ncbi:MAG: SNF2-related protein [Streptococcus sp.]|jgi:SNF2 family DNA or RNA helicase|uniref:SNF2-related protein n=1 Tax=Streptococcus sp. TaxID=1306 RepID=UPI0039953BCB